MSALISATAALFGCEITINSKDIEQIHRAADLDTLRNDVLLSHICACALKTHARNNLRMRYYIVFQSILYIPEQYIPLLHARNIVNVK